MTTLTGPFNSVLVPYDGSEPARAALAQALVLLQPAARLVVVTVVDEAPLISEAGAAMVAYDPTEMFEALDDEGKALLADAVSRCAEAKVTPVTELVHDTPVPAILATAKKHACDLIVMGTHARTGLGRLFLGSTTEGVLRWSEVPVLTVRAEDAVQREPFATALVGLADSEASDAAAALAANLEPAFKTHVVAVHLEKNPAEGLLAAARECHATVIVVGSHGRRGLRGFFLGSVAESVVRASDLPVLVVRERAAEAAA
jgi:nucleotide-binding universal stress UspA family protein